MESSAYILSTRRTGSQIVQNSSMRASEADAFMDICARFRQEGRDEATAQYEAELNKKEQEIAQLKAMLAATQGPLGAPSESSRVYHFNASCFPKPNGNLIIDALIDLVDSKREGGKYIINNKTDWYMVWKVLRYFKVYTGSVYDFVYLVNECVLPYICDTRRKETLMVADTNLKAIQKDNPMKKVSVDNWRRALDRQREGFAESPVLHGTFVLDRGINIKVRIQKLLQERGVDSFYYEK